jgi:hypothetical protein
MMPRRVRFAVSFDRAFRDLQGELRTATREAIRAFIDRSRENALQPGLKQGLRGIWTFRVDRGHRVFYRRERDEQGLVHVLFHVGPHDDYRTIMRRRSR